MKQRALVFYREHRDIVHAGAAFLIAGTVYLLLVSLTPIRIPCVLHLITGLYCPGCGISRFFIELIHLRILSAVQQNLAVAILMPVWGVLGILEFWFNPKCLSKGSPLVKVLTWGSVALLVLFGIVRNIPSMAFLLPTI